MALPLVLEPAMLADLLEQIDRNGGDQKNNPICLVDLRSREAYAAAHLPGSVHGNAALLNRAEPPVGGLLPEKAAVDTFLQEIGARAGDQIIAYDGGLETAAGRLLWVLDAYGYEASSWLNGGFAAWQQGGHPISTDPVLATTPTPEALSLSLIGDNVISAEGLMSELGSDRVRILDVRSASEYQGTDVRSASGGHVPGASHLEWTTMLDDQGRLLDDETLQRQLDELGIKTDDTVIVYCQTHQRSAVTYVALKHLGYADVRALDGAWSNWGNRSDTPKH